jgi:DNA polymerase III alpha subunit
MLLKTDDLGIPRFSNRDLIDMIYSGNVEKCHVVLCDQNDDVDKFNAAMEAQGMSPLQKYIPLDVDQKTFDGACQSEWFMPDEYKLLAIEEWLFAKVMQELQNSSTDFVYNSSQWIRVEQELEAYKERGMYDLLRYMVYLVDFMRENGIVWGVGRGSSVASYVLYMIGVHRIDSIKYNLDWREFLR